MRSRSSHQPSQKKGTSSHRVGTVKVTCSFFIVILSRERLTSLIVLQNTMNRKQKKEIRLQFSTVTGAEKKPNGFTLFVMFTLYRVDRTNAQTPCLQCTCSSFHRCVCICLREAASGWSAVTLLSSPLLLPPPSPLCQNGFLPGAWWACTVGCP